MSRFKGDCDRCGDKFDVSGDGETAFEAFIAWAEKHTDCEPSQERDSA